MDYMADVALNVTKEGQTVTFIVDQVFNLYALRFEIFVGSVEIIHRNC